MNSVHDMGGMHGLGPIEHDTDGPVFHAPWEGRVFALDRAVRGRWNANASRYQREQIPAAEYLRMSYFERVLAGMTALLVSRGVASPSEIESGTPDPGASRGTPILPAARVSTLVTKGLSARRPSTSPPRFVVGQIVRARNINPMGHTRLPRYARGRLGTVERHHGVFVFPDVNAQSADEDPRHVYSVRFAARELWGEQARPQDAVFIDLWEPYLEPA